MSVVVQQNRETVGVLLDSTGPPVVHFFSVIPSKLYMNPTNCTRSYTLPQCRPSPWVMLSQIDYVESMHSSAMPPIEISSMASSVFVEYSLYLECQLLQTARLLKCPDWYRFSRMMHQFPMRSKLALPH